MAYCNLIHWQPSSLCSSPTSSSGHDTLKGLFFKLKQHVLFHFFSFFYFKSWLGVIFSFLNGFCQKPRCFRRKGNMRWLFKKFMILYSQKCSWAWRILRSHKSSGMLVEKYYVIFSKVAEVPKDSDRHGVDFSSAIFYSTLHFLHLLLQYCSFQ